MRLLILCFLALSALAGEVQFLKPASWLGDLLVTEVGAVLGAAGKILVLDETGKVRGELPFPGGQIQALSWHKEKGVLAAGGWNLIRLWKWPSGEVLLDISGFGTMARSLAFSQDLLLCGGTDGRVLAFDLEGKLLWSLRAHESTVWGIATSSGSGPRKHRVGHSHFFRLFRHRWFRPRRPLGNRKPKGNLFLPRKGLGCSLLPGRFLLGRRRWENFENLGHRFWASPP